MLAKQSIVAIFTLKETIYVFWIQNYPLHVGIDIWQSGINLAYAHVPVEDIDEKYLSILFEMNIL